MKGLLSLLIFSMVLPAHAGIVIYGTRIIYPAENKEVMVQLMNQGNRSSLLQAWIDDGDTSLPPEKIQVPFMGNDSNLLIVFYVQIMPDDFVMQLHRF